MLHKIRMDKLVCEALDSVLVLVGDDRDACTMWFIYGHELFVCLDVQRGSRGRVDANN